MMLSWDEARAECTLYGGWLLALGSLQEQNCLMNAGFGNTAYWNYWYWTDGNIQCVFMLELCKLFYRVPEQWSFNLKRSQENSMCLYHSSAHHAQNCSTDTCCFLSFSELKEYCLVFRSKSLHNSNLYRFDF